ncbi:YgaP family membrane protein [Cochlodiniinecator piscidefendens]|uniref:YgaP family membrane protein n=1 Tax=Cochlodiniinecator piscidefendens TaxID=2715756 RepID=UPI0014095044|nr:DUF2892 domain-containing protein [Cochlodiniinecator piscidefendens]
MKQNVGQFDRILRALLGVVLIVLAVFYLVGWLKWGALLVGAVMLFVALSKSCPIYSLLGIKTCKM